MLKGRISALALFSAALGMLVFAPSAAFAQNQFNGVIVDADGVMRMRSYDDPGGQLSRERIAAARAALDQDILRKSPMRKVSINRLEAMLQDALANDRQPTEAMRNLAGMTRVKYVFYYPETKDIVIAGPAEGWIKDLSGRTVGLDSGQPTLELQDLIVALRTFAPDSEDAPIVGVSIDPTQEGLQRMQQFMSNLGNVQPSDAHRIAAGLRTSLGLQDVIVRGVAADTHFAQVLVEADYRMKLIGIGLEQPPVKMTTYIDKAKPSSVSRNAMKRWYFVPDYERVRVTDDEMAMEMAGEGVKLIGEDEVVDAKGRRAATRQADRASRLFTQSFTRVYPKMAMASPIWAQMRNLIDMSVAAAFIRKQGFHEKAQWDMPIFRDEEAYPVRTYNTPVTVETAVNVRWKGSTLMTPVGGGVRIEATLALEEQNLQLDDKGAVKKVQDSIKPAVLDHGRWWWD